MNFNCDDVASKDDIFNKDSDYCICRPIAKSSYITYELTKCVYEITSGGGEWMIFSPFNMELL